MNVLGNLDDGISINVKVEDNLEVMFTLFDQYIVNPHFAGKKVSKMRYAPEYDMLRFLIS